MYTIIPILAEKSRWLLGRRPALSASPPPPSTQTGQTTAPPVPTQSQGRRESGANPRQTHSVAYESRVLRHILNLLAAGLWGIGIASAAAEGIITTVAGGGPNNVPALSANIAFPGGVAIDPAGNIYATAIIPARIFKIDTAGQLTVVAGSGASRFSGDGGPAIEASLNYPQKVSLDNAGNVFIADPNDHRIRRVDAISGLITTIAGNGTRGFSGDGGAATDAALNSPYGVEVDGSGNVLIADSGNHRIRRVDASTGFISTIAGDGVQGFSGDGGLAVDASLNSPSGVAVDSAGNVYIVEFPRVRRIDAATGIIQTVAGNGINDYSGDGGPATDASLLAPSGVEVDSAGNLFIATINAIRRVDAATGLISTVPITGLFNPLDVAVDAAGNLVIASRSNHRIVRWDATTGESSPIAGNGYIGFSGDGGLATKASLDGPSGSVRDNAGNLFIADRSNHRVRRMDATTGVISTVAGNGTQGFGGDTGPATEASLAYPSGIALDSHQNLFIADQVNNRIRRVDAGTGLISTVAGGGNGGDGIAATSASLNYPAGVTVDSAGNLLIADSSNHRVRRVDAATGLISTVAGNGTPDFIGDGGPASEASLSFPTAVSLDGASNLFIADLNNRRIRRVDATTGLISTVAGNGSYGFSGDGISATEASLADPFGITLDRAGNLFIADLGNSRVRRVAADSGLISTVAGNGSYGFSGDGGEASNAKLASPVGVVLDGTGNLYITDGDINRVRRVTPSLAITCPAPVNGTVGQAVILGSPTVTGATNPTITNNAPATFLAGTTVVTWTASSGNSTATCTQNVTMRYAFSGFFSPVANPPTWNPLKAGSIVKLKFSLAGNWGLGILAAGSPSVQQLNCSTAALQGSPVAADPSGLSFDAKAGQYFYTWRTSAAWKNLCFQLNIKLNDGTAHPANFQFKAK